ncbi:hypothetical protein QUT07_22515, partial [Xanthomonas citri pv. citri]
NGASGDIHQVDATHRQDVRFTPGRRRKTRRDGSPFSSNATDCDRSSQVRSLIASLPIADDDIRIAEYLHV